MSFEQIVYEHLRDSSTLEPFLAKYAEKPAVFNQQAPDDIDPLWWDKSQYGRVIFAANLRGDPERKISGTLILDVICHDGEQVPEEVEPVARELIDGYFFSDEEEGVTFSASWRNSAYFTDPTKSENGVTLEFDLLAYPNQTTGDPDPIALLNSWTKENLPDAFVIGTDELPKVWKPTNESPAIYWRLINISKCVWIPDTFSCSWQTATVTGHILTPDKQSRGQIAKWMSSYLTTKRRLIFPDNSPLMTDRNIRINPAADPMKQGQITLDATYGILNEIPVAAPIKNISINQKEGGNA